MKFPNKFPYRSTMTLPPCVPHRCVESVAILPPILKKGEARGKTDRAGEKTVMEFKLPPCPLLLSSFASTHPPLNASHRVIARVQIAKPRGDFSLLVRPPNLFYFATRAVADADRPVYELVLAEICVQRTKIMIMYLPIRLSRYSRTLFGLCLSSELISDFVT